MAQYRKESLERGYYYHIFSRSIAKFIIFNNAEEYSRFFEIINLYRYEDFDHKYSRFIRLELATQNEILERLQTKNNFSVEIVAYCIMPTHFHLILKQISDRGISKFMGKVLNCYSRYFNVKHKRTGPLWSGRFKSVLINNDDQLLHLTRYIHLNPTSAGVTQKPENWLYSSYGEYTGALVSRICKHNGVLEIEPSTYKKFVMNRKDYQRRISHIKSLLIDDYTG